MQPPRSLYDEVPYESRAFTETHPDRLATVATLFGLKPPAVETCRVLELGCADGANLIPMALGVPDGSFVGVDLSQRQIGDGQALIEAFGLKNIKLQARSITDVGEADGQFDYIVCHGVYSWVPPAVQDHILTVCQRNLAPNGIAYISYNTYPGWHVRRMVRDLLCYHARRVSDPREQVRQARAFLEFLGQSVVADANTTYATSIRGAVEALKQRSDSYILHEYLEEHNEPCYFHEFVARGRQHGLEYVGDANIGTMLLNRFPVEVQDTLRRLSADSVQLEQYLDFLTNRPFRRSLLCHAGLQPKYALQPDVVSSLYVSSLAKPVSPRPNLFSDAAEEFRLPEGTGVATREPLLKAALLHLAEVRPQAVPFQQLWQAACERSTPAEGSPPSGPRDPGFLAARVLGYYLSGLVQLHSYSPRCTGEVSAQPVASPLARHQTGFGRRVTNLRHELIEVSEVGRHLLARLDGTQDRQQLLDSLLELQAQGQLRMEKNGQPVQDPAVVRDQLGHALDQTLHLLARSGCLLA